jgi:hypothetical protein
MLVGARRRHPKRIGRMLMLELWLGAAVSLHAHASIQDSALAARQSTVEWELGVLNESNSVSLTKAGSPRTIDCPYGRAVYFDGVGDALFLDANPLQNLRQFTVEVLLRPDPNGPPEQRFLHMGEMRGDRMMLETRMTDDGQWYLDAHIRSGDSAKTLIDRQKTHLTGVWHHIALVVDSGRMNTYVEGKHELEGSVRFSPFSGGKTSIGARMNRVYWFKGAICKIRITPKCLNPSDFAR